MIARDIGERKRAEAAKLLLEEQLRQAQKMEAVGQLAGGIAHDFNNLLTVISGYTEILLPAARREAEGSSENRRDQQGGRARGAAHAPAARLQPQAGAASRRSLDLERVLAETSDDAAAADRRGHRARTELARELGRMQRRSRTDRAGHHEPGVNARDAMPDGGTLMIETAAVTFAEDDAGGRARDARPGRYVLLAVTDTGLGHGRGDARHRIFEPFFTTKERGKGTGLGLATVYGIVKQSGGHIAVDSEPGRGTTFRLYFPQATISETEAFSPAPPDERSLFGSETVLLVEDEQALREVGKLMLESYGYNVLLAGDGVAGLELAESHAGPIELLMTDILMPRMGGIELAERLSSLNPELRVLYTSGYNDSGGALKKLGGARYLQKPYSMEDLARTLRALLDSDRSEYRAPSVPLV